MKSTISSVLVPSIYKQT